jgi:ATPase subunit of ABC transporter with duplicated ATPase domains
LQKYDGTVLLVTHDHDVIDEVATRIWHFDHGPIEDFKGPYADFLVHEQQKAQEKLAPGKGPSGPKRRLTSK